MSAAESILGRLRALEKSVRAEANVRHAYSHAQLCGIVQHLNNGESMEEAERLVGPPEAILGPGEKSIEELIMEGPMSAAETNTGRQNDPELDAPSIRARD